MPPGRIYTITRENNQNILQISHGVDLTFEKEMNSSLPIFSAHWEDRDIRNSRGDVVGKDRWGYFKTGEHWRYIKIFTWDEMG